MKQKQHVPFTSDVKYLSPNVQNICTNVAFFDDSVRIDNTYRLMLESYRSNLSAQYRLETYYIYSGLLISGSFKRQRFVVVEEVMRKFSAMTIVTIQKLFV